MNHNQELMVREGDEKLWIIQIEPEILVIHNGYSQPEKEWDLEMSSHANSDESYGGCKLIILV